MSAPVCYLVRADRGAQLVGLRVVDRHDEATWHAPMSDSPDLSADARQAAEWLAAKLSSNGRMLSKLVVDSDGGVCSWVSASDTSEPVLRAIIERPFDEEGASSGERFPELPGETALQPLITKPGGKKHRAGEADRVPVLALPVVPARSLVDELDRLGVRVGSVEALWQACAEAWDPSARARLGGDRAERVIAEQEPTSAVVLFDPAGRLVWSWSRGGTLIAGGSMRLLTELAGASAPDVIERGQTRRAVVRQDDIARLGSEWLAWSLQLGVAPSRVIIVGEPSESGLSAAEVGQALSSTWPDATIDFIREQDPVGATLSRLADSDGPESEGISELTNRPGRAHRAMYRWSAAALLCGAGVLGAAAWRITRATAELKEERSTISQMYADLCAREELAPPTALLDLDRRLQALKSTQRDISKLIEPPRPILEELEALSFVLSSDDLTLRDLSLTSVSVTLKVDVPQTETYESLRQAINSISGSSIDWRSTPISRNNRIEASFTGTWPSTQGGEN